HGRSSYRPSTSLFQPFGHGRLNSELPEAGEKTWMAGSEVDHDVGARDLRFSDSGYCSIHQCAATDSRTRPADHGARTTRSDRKPLFTVADTRPRRIQFGPNGFTC